MGTGPPERLTAGSQQPRRERRSCPSGTCARSSFASPRRSTNLALPGAARRGPMQPLVKTPFLEQNGEVSPDCRWFAYESNESGPFHVYVRPYPDVDSGRWTSRRTAAPTVVVARRQGALLPVEPARADARRSETRRRMGGRRPRRIFDLSPPPPPLGGTARSYDQAPDGRFIVIRSAGFVAPRLVLVSGWIRELQAVARAQGGESK